MFGIDDMLLLSAIGAGTGALFNRKKPLEGALIGAGLGAAGGAIAPSFGLLGNTAAGSVAAEQAAAPVVEMGTKAAAADIANAQGVGLLGQVDKIGKPVATALNAANSAKGLLSEPPPQMPSPLQHAPLDLSGVLKQNTDLMSFDAQEAARRRALMQQYINNIGGGYGRVA